MHVNNEIILLRNMRRNIRDKVDHSNERNDIHQVNEQYFLLLGVLIESSEYISTTKVTTHKFTHTNTKKRALVRSYILKVAVFSADTSSPTLEC